MVFKFSSHFDDVAADVAFHLSYVSPLYLTFILQEAELCYMNAIKIRNFYPDAYYNLANLVNV